MAMVMVLHLHLPLQLRARIPLLPALIYPIKPPASSRIRPHLPIAIFAGCLRVLPPHPPPPTPRPTHIPPTKTWNATQEQHRADLGVRIVGPPGSAEEVGVEVCSGEDGGQTDRTARIACRQPHQRCSSVYQWGVSRTVALVSWSWRASSATLQRGTNSKEKAGASEDLDPTPCFCIPGSYYRV
ncbi:hypothetical protein B0H12DRAFT_1075157 [Mycena haematopus]|nr:hypothetical protein B0H12DRAFT_1075157 [Mycena haematopus]